MFLQCSCPECLLSTLYLANSSAATTDGYIRGEHFTAGDKVDCFYGFSENNTIEVLLDKYWIHCKCLFSSIGLVIDHMN